MSADLTGLKSIIAHHEFVEACGGVDAAMRFETTLLSVGDEFLPQEARDVRDGKIKSPSPTYWKWLLSQVSP